MKRNALSGFTLVEIMIVIAVIMILSFISIPNMLRSSVTANEAGAICSLRSLYTALQIYYADNNKVYPLNLNSMSNYISPKLASGSKGGYSFAYVYDNQNSFHINANPDVQGRTGSRYFYLDQTAVLRYDLQGEADENDPIVE